MPSANQSNTPAPDLKAGLLPLIPTEDIGGVPIAALTRQETAHLMADVAFAARGISAPALVFSSANGQVLSAVAKSPLDSRGIPRALGGAHVISADGQPLVFASKLLGMGDVRERCATTDLFHDVVQLSVRTGLKHYMLGASAQENRRAVDNVMQCYPGLQVIGSRAGYFESFLDEQCEVESINRLEPDIVWVGLGFPREQEFCERWRNVLTKVGILKTSGGLFNYLSGTRSRAPAWMQAMGMEWSYRLALEPGRLFARYAKTNVHATWLLVTRTGSQLNGREVLRKWLSVGSGKS
jgi:N-acetylglucosaminyldiphosphoundecaprenol N-acetyl-beta-D-mannosaminyltransferase